jgi:hypothetical protein
MLCEYCHLKLNIGKSLTQDQTSQHSQAVVLVRFLEPAALSSNQASVPAQIEASPFLGNGSSRFILCNNISNWSTGNAVKGTIKPPLPHDLGD